MGERLMCCQTRSSRKKTQKRKFEKEEQKERKVNNNKNTGVSTDNFQKDRVLIFVYIF